MSHHEKKTIVKTIFAIAIVAGTMFSSRFVLQCVSTFTLSLLKVIMLCLLLFCRYAPPQHTQPVLTAIGSPNFGHRSVYRDVEAQVFLITANRALRNELYHELHNLKGYCHPVQEESVRKLKEQTGPAAHLAVKLLQGFL